MALAPLKLNRLQRFDKLVDDTGVSVKFQTLWQETVTALENNNGELIDALVLIASLQSAVAGKNAIFVQTGAPTATGVNDLWIDSDDGNKPYRWNGSAWIEVQDIGAALALGSINLDGTIATDKVVNDSVLAGAVLTTPGGTTTGSTTLTSGSYTWFEVASETITAAGVPLTVSADFEIEVIDNCKFQYRLLCDGVVLGRELGPISVNTSDQPGVTITRRHTPTAGSREYTLEVSVNDANDLIVHDPLLNFTENRNL